MGLFEKFTSPKEKQPTKPLTLDTASLRGAIEEHTAAVKRLEIAHFELQNLDTFVRPLERMRIKLELYDGNIELARLKGSPDLATLLKNREEMNAAYRDKSAEWEQVLANKRVELGL